MALGQPTNTGPTNTGMPSSPKLGPQRGGYSQPQNPWDGLIGGEGGMGMGGGAPILGGGMGMGGSQGPSDSFGSTISPPSGGNGLAPAWDPSTIPTMDSGGIGGTGITGVDQEAHQDMQMALNSELQGDNTWQNKNATQGQFDISNAVDEYSDMVMPETTNAYLEQGERPQVETRSVNEPLPVALDAGTEEDEEEDDIVPVTQPIDPTPPVVDPETPPAAPPGPPPPPPNPPSITPENWSDIFSAIGLSGAEADQFRIEFYTNLWNRITGNVNSYTPFGSNVYTMDPNTGQFSNITTLNPTLQAAMAAQQNSQRRAAERAYQLMGTPGFSDPFSLNLDAYGMPTAFDATAGENNPYTQAAYDKAMQMIEPQQQNEKDMVRSQLANQGIAPDSEAGRRALDELDRRHTYQNDVAMNNAWQQGMTSQAQQYQQMMQNRGQAGTEQMTQHQQRWADLLNMMNMGQVYQQPGTAHAAGGNMVSPDILGYRSNQDQLALMNRQRQDNNFWSGIGAGLGIWNLFGG